MRACLKKKEKEITKIELLQGSMHYLSSLHVLIYFLLPFSFFYSFLLFLLLSNQLPFCKIYLVFRFIFFFSVLFWYIIIIHTILREHSVRCEVLINVYVHCIKIKLWDLTYPFPQIFIHYEFSFIMFCSSLVFVWVLLHWDGFSLNYFCLWDQVLSCLAWLKLMIFLTHPPRLLGL